MYRTLVATLVILSLWGCGRKETLAVKNKNQVANSVSSLRCDGAQAVLSFAAPVPAAVRAGDSVELEVAATGCDAVWALENDPNVRFTASRKFKKTYGTPGSASETVNVLALDPDTGSLIRSIATKTLEFRVLDANDPSVTSSAPTCLIRKVAGATHISTGVQFRFETNGTVTSGTINQLPIASGEVRRYAADPQGQIHLYGSVTGPGGSRTCEAHVALPSCGLTATPVATDTWKLTLTLRGPVSAATMPNAPVILPAPPQNTVSRVVTIIGASADSVATAFVESAEGDQSFCSAPLRQPELKTFRVESGSGYPYPMIVPDSLYFGSVKPNISGPSMTARLDFINRLKVEKVVVRINFWSWCPDDLTFDLVSPAGTTAQVQRSVVQAGLEKFYRGNSVDKSYSPDPRDESSETFYIPLLDRFRGESSEGQWKLEGRDWSWFGQGQVNSWSLEITGTPR